MTLGDLQGVTCMNFTKNFICLAVLSIMLLSGCGTTPPPEFSGKWRPVNRFSSDTQAIPLHSTYIYYATPMDYTLKGLLTRWSGDNGLVLRYQTDMDYTLHQPVAAVKSTSLAAALGELSDIYRTQGIEVVLDDRTITVRPVLVPVMDDAQSSQTGDGR